jgi:cell wall-associated NlpC family hydrolase
VDTVRGLALVAFFVTLLTAQAAAADTTQSWAKSSIAAVTRAGLFPETPATFRPADPLTQEALAGVISHLGGPVMTPVDPGGLVTIGGLDAALVNALGLHSAAHEFYLGARNAGLRPPSRFGTEVTARLLGLRTDLADDSLELQPQQPATRADAAFSAARVLALAQPYPGAPAPDATPLAAAIAGGSVRYVDGLASTFALPQLTPWQAQVLQTGVSLIGYPYVWGGENETTDRGFDCSGFVWRVYKLASYPGGEALPGTLQGRTAAQMAAEVPKSMRIPRTDLQPGDVLFFGPGRHMKATTIDHTAIYLGNGWMINASGQGVSLALLDWEGKRFAWGRRPLTEAGLEPPLDATSLPTAP